MKFSTFLSRGAVALLALSLLCGAATAAQPNIPPMGFLPITPQQPTESGKRIEVLEFFWYGCPHCNRLQPSLHAWLKKKPADVDFRRVPAVFDDSWIPLTLAYYALDALGEEGRLHDQVFAAIHEQKVQLSNPKVLFEWMEKHGIDRKKFADTYHSFGVKSRGMRSIDMTKSYDVPGTPALAVDGKYMVAPQWTLRPDGSVDYDRFFRVLDQVINTARKQRAGK